MAVTTNLGITLVDVAQAGKEVTVNAGTNILDAVVAGRLAVSVAGTGDFTMNTTQCQNHVLEFTGTLTGNRNIIFVTGSRDWIIYNNTAGAFSLTLKRSGQTGVSGPAQTKHAIFYYNGTDIARATADV